MNVRPDNDKQSQKNRPRVHLHCDRIISGDECSGHDGDGHPSFHEACHTPSSFSDTRGTYASVLRDWEQALHAGAPSRPSSATEYFPRAYEDRQGASAFIFYAQKKTLQALGAVLMK